MKKITIGEKQKDKRYDFRETCFGIGINGNKVLLVKQNEELSFIGGGIEKGETHEDCLKREFLEESGYELLDIEPFITIDCFWLASGKWPMESLANYYIVQVGEKVSEPTEAGHEPQVVEIEEAKDLLILPYHKEAIERFLREFYN